MYKLIVSDFNGTLIDNEERIPISTVLLLDKLRRINVKIAIATGSNLNRILDYNKDFIFCDYIIASNGSYVYDVNKQKVIFKKNIGIRTCKKIIKSYLDKTTICITNQNTINVIKTPISKKILDANIVEDIEKFLDDNKQTIYKIDLYYNNLKEAKKALKELKNEQLNINCYLQVIEDEIFIEIINQHISQATGVMKIITKEKIKLNEVIAFGDNYNNLELLKIVGLGVCLVSSPKEIKKIANDITVDNNSKGVEKYLEKIF